MGEREDRNLRTLDQIGKAFNRHDIEAILTLFDDDCEWLLSRGPDPWGKRLRGKAEIEGLLKERFSNMGDMHWEVEGRYVTGDRGVSEWTVTGTGQDGERLHSLGCDLWEFRNGKVTKKNTYWKIIL